MVLMKELTGGCHEKILLHIDAIFNCYSFMFLLKFRNDSNLYYEYDYD